MWLPGGGLVEVEETKDDYVRKISKLSDCYGNYLVEMMNKFNKQNLAAITLEEAKSFYLELAERIGIK